MFPEHINEKIRFFNKDKFTVVMAGEKTHVEEKSKTGTAHLECTCNKDSLVILQPEQNVLPLLDEKIKGATSCADVFIFEKCDENKYLLHIIEFKKTVNTSTFAKSMRQFTMGLYNARAIAGFLGIVIDRIILYSGYRKDTISNIEGKSLIELRADKSCIQIINMWKKGKCYLCIDGDNTEFEHKKIVLNDAGEGELAI